MSLKSIPIPHSTHLKIIKNKFSRQIVCRKTDLKVSICCEYNCRMCNLIETVFTMINNPPFLNCLPTIYLQQNDRSYQLFRTTTALMRPSRGGIQCQRPLTSRNTIIPPTGMEKESSLTVLTSTFCLAGALHTSAHSERASLLHISY